MSKVLGFIGLGNMGEPMAGRLIDAGYDLTVYDVRESAVDTFVKRGATPASSPADLASKVETVLLSLPTPDIVELVTVGNGGIASGTSVKRVVDFSTIGAEMAASLAERMKVKDVHWVDSPVSGGVGGAEAGTLAVMTAGRREDYDDLLPVLEIIGNPFYIGAAAGLGQTMKLVNNCLSAAAMAMSSEAVAMGTKAGLPPDVMIDVINAGTGRNSATVQKFPKSILTGTFQYGFTTGLMHKDVALFMAQAKDMGLDLPACKAVFQRWQQTIDAFGPDSDFTRIAQLVEEETGVEMRSSQGTGE